MIVCVEGIDGSGKTTVVRHIMEMMHGKAVNLRTPGFIPEIRSIVLDPDKDLLTETKAMLFLAEMVEVCKEIESLEKCGFHTILDRFYLSTYVYQLTKLPAAKMRVCEDFISKFLRPIDITAILQISVDAAIERSMQDGMEFSKKDAFEKDSRSVWGNRAKIYNNAHLRFAHNPILGHIMYCNSQFTPAEHIAKTIVGCMR